MAVVEMNLWDAYELVAIGNIINIDTDSGLRVSITLPAEFALPNTRLTQRKFEDKIDSTDRI